MSNQNVNQKGVRIVTEGLNTVTINYPNLIFPQQYVNNIVKYKTVDNPQELQQLLMLKQQGIDTKLMWGGQFLVPKDSADGKTIKDAVDSQWDKYNIGDKNSVYYPIIDGDKFASMLESKGKKGDLFKNMWKFKSYDNRGCPQLFNEYGEFKPNSDKEVDGFFVRMSCYVNYYSQPNRGVRIYLNSIQFLTKNPKFNFGGSSVFQFKPKPNTFEGSLQQQSQQPNYQQPQQPNYQQQNPNYQQTGYGQVNGQNPSINSDDDDDSLPF